MTRFFTLSLDPVNHDLHLADDGSLACVTDSAAVAQRVKQRLKFWRSEWFLDRTAGVPWLQHVYVEPFDQGLADAVIKAEIQRVPGVAEILSYSSEFNRETRELKAYQISLRTEFDEVVTLNA